MSTFNGKIAEIDGISVDNFLGDNFQSNVYFLSHCHSDHMKGLWHYEFQKQLCDRNEVFLYASPVSVLILKRMYPQISEKLKDLPLWNSTLVSIPHNNDVWVSVTPIPAGHCPGSVMFLFEIKNKRILYTGDFRINPRDFTKFKAFYDSYGELKRFNSVYLDTTFCKKEYENFQARQNSVDQIYKISKEWLDEDQSNNVRIETCAKYGSEFLFMELSKKFKMPVHVGEEQYNVYKHVPELDNAITRDAKTTRLHSAFFRNSCCNNLQSVRTVKSSAWHWTNKAGHQQHAGSGRFFRVCYSCHPSLSETREFLKFLKPEEVVPCVVPDKEFEKNEMLQLISETVDEYKTSSVVKNTRKLFKLDDSEPESSPSSLDILSSPEREFKRKRV